MEKGDRATYIPNEKYHAHFGRDTVTILCKHEGGYWVAFDKYEGENNAFLAADEELRVSA